MPAVGPLTDGVGRDTHRDRNPPGYWDIEGVDPLRDRDIVRRDRTIMKVMMAHWLITRTRLGQSQKSSQEAGTLHNRTRNEQPGRDDLARIQIGNEQLTCDGVALKAPYSMQLKDKTFERGALFQLHISFEGHNICII